MIESVGALFYMPAMAGTFAPEKRFGTLLGLLANTNEWGS